MPVEDCGPRIDSLEDALREMDRVRESCERLWEVHMEERRYNVLECAPPVFLPDPVPAELQEDHLKQPGDGPSVPLEEYCERVDQSVEDTRSAARHCEDVEVRESIDAALDALLNALDCLHFSAKGDEVA